MKKWLVPCLVSVFCYTIAYAAAPLASPHIQHLQPLNDLTEEVSPYVKHIREAYEVLSDPSKVWSQNNFEETISAINSLRISFFQEINPDKSLPDENDLILTLMNININIRTMLESSKYKLLMRDLFNSTLERISQRCSLGRISQRIFNREGWIGSQVFINIPGTIATKRSRFENTVRHLLGRIFVTDNDKIISMSSGMLIPYNKESEKHYDRIVTCGHSMQPLNANPDIEFYFVRCECLIPETGLPDTEAIKAFINENIENQEEKIEEAAQTTIKTKHFIKYLRLQSQKGEFVRRIVKFTTPDDSDPNHTSILNHHSPKYISYKDRGWGHLERNFNLSSQKLAAVSFGSPSSSSPYQYHAMGYPSFPHLSIDDQKDVLTKELRLAPLTMVLSHSNDVTADGKTVLKKKEKSHWRIGTPVAKGMSGGPVLVFDSTCDTIWILGVISSFSFVENYMCSFS